MRMKIAQGKYQTLSGFCCELMEKGLMIKEKEVAAAEAEINNK